MAYRWDSGTACDIFIVSQHVTKGRPTCGLQPTVNKLEGSQRVTKPLQSLKAALSSVW